MRAEGFKKGINSVVVRVGCVWWRGGGGGDPECVKRRDDLLFNVRAARNGESTASVYLMLLVTIWCPENF